MASHPRARRVFIAPKNAGPAQLVATNGFPLMSQVPPSPAKQTHQGVGETHEDLWVPLCTCFCEATLPYSEVKCHQGPFEAL